MTTSTRKTRMGRPMAWVLAGALLATGARAAEPSTPGPAATSAPTASAATAATQPETPERVAARRAVVSSVRALTRHDVPAAETKETRVTLPSGERLRAVPVRGAQVVIATRRADGSLVTACVGSEDAAERFLASPPAGAHR